MTAETVTIPARRGKAARVRKGQRITIISTHGTQVVDTWAFSAEDPTEWMSMEASRAWFLKLAAAVGDSFVTNRRRPDPHAGRGHLGRRARHADGGVRSPSATGCSA